MNSPAAAREIPACIAKSEPDAVFAWYSTRRLLVIKDGTTVSLSADDLRNMRRFFDSFDMGPTS